mgnify:CR=1 FL=1
MLAPYAAAGDVVKVRDNLVGAKYTLAVPDYLHEQGLRDFADIQRFRKELGASIYGIEPGNDGNGHVLELIRKNELGLGGFKLVESSEQGMLAQVERAYRARQPVEVRRVRHRRDDGADPRARREAAHRQGAQQGDDDDRHRRLGDRKSVV